MARPLIPIDSYRSNTHPAKRGFYAERHETLSSCCLQQQSLMRAAVTVRGPAAGTRPGTSLFVSPDDGRQSSRRDCTNNN